MRTPNRSFSKTFLASTLLLCATARADFSLDFETGAVWSGKNDVRIPGDSGDLFSLTDDLKADQPAAFFRARATWHINDRHDVSALYAPLSMDYSGTFDRSIDFRDGVLNPGVPTQARFRFDSYRLTYRYNFIKTDKITFGLGLTAKMRDAEISVSQPGNNLYDDNTGFVPLINFRFAWQITDDFSLLAEGDALASSRGRAEDVMAAIQWQATDNLAFRLGYRILEGGSDSDDVYSFSLFHYAVVGATIRF
jgi:hypothetical protein